MSAAQDDDTRDGVWTPRFAPVAQIIPPNVFADMDVKVAAAVASGADVIDLAKGNPDAYPADSSATSPNRRSTTRSTRDTRRSMVSRRSCRPPRTGTATCMVSNWTGVPSCSPWKARSTGSPDCSRF